MNRAFLTLPVLLALAACASPPTPPAPPALTRASPEAMVAAIRASAGTDDEELAVQPLRDPRVEDLRAEALRLEGAQQYDEAARRLDAALAIVPDDPALLQERAEAALLQRDFDAAESFARQAIAIGAQVGPLCRRHWATLRQVRLQAGDEAGADAARERTEACTLARPNRY